MWRQDSGRRGGGRLSHSWRTDGKVGTAEGGDDGGHASAQNGRRQRSGPYEGEPAVSRADDVIDSEVLAGISKYISCVHIEGMYLQDEKTGRLH